MQCLAAGKHVLGEKPISNNIEHAARWCARPTRWASTTASTSTTALCRRRRKPRGGSKRANWVTCCSSI
ncbi:MAG: hypothetical protein R2867_16700 [Caldilineaceae bacterium]